jgi:membrane fusion protein (multidrug efflux system)
MNRKPEMQNPNDRFRTRMRAETFSPEPLKGAGQLCVAYAIQSCPSRFVLAAILIASVAGCRPATDTADGKKVEAPVSVKVASPRRGEILRTVSLPATVAANQQATLYSKVGGYLKTIAVDKGDEVKQGQLLAEIEVPELIADFARNKAEAEIANLDYKRAVEAHEKAPDLVVQQSVDGVKAKSLMAKANLERAETLIGFCRITAPFSGVITRRSVDAGAFIPAATSGSAAQNAAVVTLMDFDKVRVQVAVPEPEVPLIKNRLPVKVVVEELPGRAFEGSVTRFSQALDDASKTMLAEIDLENPKRELRPGMYATAKIGVEKHTDALLIPVEALVMEKAIAFAFVADGGKAKKTAIKIGFNDGAKVEVLTGLTGSEAVILVGKMTLTDGAAVNAVETK